MAPILALALAYFVAFTVASPASPKVARQQNSCSVGLIEAEILLMDAMTTTLDSDIARVPDSGATSTQTYAVDSDIFNIVIELSNTFAVIQTSLPQPCSGPFSENDFQGILTRLQTLSSDLTVAMSNLAKKRGAFDSTGTTEIVRSDLQSLANGMSGVENLLLSKAPSDLLAQAQSLANTINNTLNAVVNAFSG
ncbi:hypothetical protein L218DRAFT_552628 [Marasmius fiardii PR-910]|nr:hypothetical protein L218DRAFT_552628 [Marasmius fiardii PR-910]